MNLIYIIGEEGTDQVKVGISSVPPLRVNGLQTGNPRNLILLAIWPGTKEDEANLHSKLAPSHARGEWFTANDYIHKLIQKHPAPPLPPKRSGGFRKPSVPPSELILLELSQAFAQAIEAGMIKPDGRALVGNWTFRLEFCPDRQMVLLPTCPGCG